MADLIKLIEVLKGLELVFEVTVRGGKSDNVERIQSSLRFFFFF